MGWSYEQYVTAAEAAERRVKTWRRAAVLAALSIGCTLVDNKLIAAPLPHSFAYKINTLHIVRRLLRRVFAVLTNTYRKWDTAIYAFANKSCFHDNTEGWNRGGRKLA